MESNNKPSLKDVVGFANKVRVLTGNEPSYDTDTLNQIVGRGVSPVEMSNQSGTNRETVGFHSWQSVYDALIAAGLSEERAKEETNARVWILD